jgi:3-deoxy-7-phosphoheptulonate synthase
MSSALATHKNLTDTLESPRRLRERLSADAASLSFVAESRRIIRAILRGHDPRLLVVAGPCSVHDPDAALRYGEEIRRISEPFGEELFVVMRVYFEKPRTSVGWKGLISDPDLDGSGNVSRGLCTARRVLLGVAGLELPAATEVLDPLVPAYLADLVSWAAIGARTTESQTHRQLASGLPMPVGFKNGTDGGIGVALNAMLSARESHALLGIDDDGMVSCMKTLGNPDTHLVLRGGKNGPNFSRRDVARAAHKLCEAGLSRRILVDAAHGNSRKDPQRQPEVVDHVARQVRSEENHVLGVMIESNLVAGRQALAPPAPLRFGQSITDPCVDLDTTRAMLGRLANACAARKKHHGPPGHEHPGQTRVQPLS